MKIRYTTTSGRLVFEMEASTAKQAFETVAALQELFEEPSCGKCKSKNLVCEVREPDGNKYYSLRCGDCHAQLDFGQYKDGSGLFIKRKDKNGTPMIDRGWYHWHSREHATMPPRAAGPSQSIPPAGKSMAPPPRRNGDF